MYERVLCKFNKFLQLFFHYKGEELPDDEVEEVVEEFEETLEDGTVRKVTRKRIIKRTYQMVEVDPNDPDAIPEGVEGDDVHR